MLCQKASKSLAVELSRCCTIHYFPFVGFLSILSNIHFRTVVCFFVWQVYARVSPEQKELIVKTMRSLGRTLMMCGDGTNDVGGLKAAHVGVALLSATDTAVCLGSVSFL
jgi:hypothetical protein